MMGKLFYTTLGIGLVALLVSLSVARHSETLLHPILPPPTATPDPYDSIRTDLSDYSWPTDAGRVMTSTFAEFRRSHFHGGIDVSTGNRTGYRVFATRDGYVARISVSPNGYGKMLYVRHHDGYYTTYAHLARFNKEISARVAREQTRRECYPVSIECTPTEFPVRKGDIIAYTGDTGVGTPHLHFEIRDENLNPVNPLLGENINATDNIAPAFRRVAIAPLGEESMVDRTWQPRIFNARLVKGNRYRIAETIQLTGTIGMAVEVRDRSNGSHYKHGVYSHKLYIDGTLVYAVHLDRVPGKEAHQIGLYYDWSLLDRGRGRFEKLYMDSQNDLPFYEPKANGAGVIHTGEFAEGPHEFRIVSTDFNNNSSELDGRLLLNHAPDFDIDKSHDSLRLTFDDITHVSKILLYAKRHSQSDWTLKTMTPEGYANGNLIDIGYLKERADVVKVVAENAWGTRSLPRFHFIHKPEERNGALFIEREVGSDFVRVIVRASQPITSVPRVFIYEGSDKRTITLRAIDIDEYVGTFRPSNHMGMRRLVAEAEINGRTVTSNDEFEMFPLRPQHSGTIELDGGNLLLSYDSSSVFKTVLMQMTKHLEDDEVHYTLMPENTVLNKPIRVSVTVNPAKRGQGLFFHGLGDMELLSSSNQGSETRLQGTISRTLGDLSVMVDDTPPHISRLNIARTSSRRPVITFHYGDNLSGVEYNELKMYIDSVVVIPEIDGEHRRAVYQVNDPLERGSHHLTIRITDKMGNTSEVERRFTVR